MMTVHTQLPADCLPLSRYRHQLRPPKVLLRKHRALPLQSIGPGGPTFQFSGSVSTHCAGIYPLAYTTAFHYIDFDVIGQSETITLDLTSLSMVGYDGQQLPGFYWAVLDTTRTHTLNWGSSTRLKSTRFLSRRGIIALRRACLSSLTATLRSIGLPPFQTPSGSAISSGMLATGVLMASG